MIRVIVERRCRQGKEAELQSLLLELRNSAMHQHGYISGETLRSVDDPSVWLVLSTWADVDLWRMWEATPERRNIVERMKPLLVVPEKVSVFSFDRKGVTLSAHTVDR